MNKNISFLLFESLDIFVDYVNCIPDSETRIIIPSDNDVASMLVNILRHSSKILSVYDSHYSNPLYTKAVLLVTKNTSADDIINAIYAHEIIEIVKIEES